MDHVDKVRKLRALAERATFPAEALAARERADALMARHGLTEAQVAPLPPPERHSPFPAQRGAWTVVVNGQPVNMPGPIWFPVGSNGTSAPGWVHMTVRFG
jgi:hypothetical protein